MCSLKKYREGMDVNEKKGEESRKKNVEEDIGKMEKNEWKVDG